MATEAQVAANRLNAQKSTGPRTVEGKAAASQNAVRHGLLAVQAVVRGESVEEYQAYREAVVGDLQPVGAVEFVLAERVVGLMWRLRRVQRLESEAFEVMYRFEAQPGFDRMTRDDMAKVPAGPQGELGQADFVVGRALRRDFAGQHVLERLGLYERRIERSLYRTMAELKKVQEARRAEEAVEEDTAAPETTDASCRVDSQPTRQDREDQACGPRTHPIFVEAFENRRGAETSGRREKTLVEVGGLNG